MPELRSHKFRIEQAIGLAIDVTSAASVAQGRATLDAVMPIVEELAAWAQPAVDVDGGAHIIEFRAEGWTIMHPLACRPRLFDCPVNRAGEKQLTKPPAGVLGRYVVELVDGYLAIGERATEGTDYNPNVDLLIAAAEHHILQAESQCRPGWPVAGVQTGLVKADLALMKAKLAAFQADQLESRPDRRLDTGDLEAAS